MPDETFQLVDWGKHDAGLEGREYPIPDLPLSESEAFLFLSELVFCRYEKYMCNAVHTFARMGWIDADTRMQMLRRITQHLRPSPYHHGFTYLTYEASCNEDGAPLDTPVFEAKALAALYLAYDAAEEEEQRAETYRRMVARQFPNPGLPVDGRPDP